MVRAGGEAGWRQWSKIGVCKTTGSGLIMLSAAKHLSFASRRMLREKGACYFCNSTFIYNTQMLRCAPHDRQSVWRIKKVFDGQRVSELSDEKQPEGLQYE